MKYKGFEIEIEWIGDINDYMYHIKKDGEYVNTYLVSKHACKLWITKKLKGEK